MKENRSVMERRIKVLECFTKRGILSYVMCKANINCTEAKEIINTFLEAGFLTKERIELRPRKQCRKLTNSPKLGKSFLYEITEKGSQFLKIWREFKKEYEKIDWEKSMKKKRVKLHRPNDKPKLANVSFTTPSGKRVKFVKAVAPSNQRFSMRRRRRREVKE